VQEVVDKGLHGVKVSKVRDPPDRVLVLFSIIVSS
jgi:hypothetical protein